jgi:uncharacterized membrane protein
MMEDPLYLQEPQEDSASSASRQEGAQSGRLSVAFVVLGVLVALFVPILGPLLALILGIIYRRSWGAIALIVLGGFFLLVHLVFNILVPMFTR